LRHPPQPIEGRVVNLGGPSRRVIERFVPQTEIRSNEPVGAWLGFETASGQRSLNRRDGSLNHWWNRKLEFLIPLSHRRPVLAFQLLEQSKIRCLLLFRQAQFRPRKAVAVDYFSLDRPLDIGKRVFRIQFGARELSVSDSAIERQCGITNSRSEN